MSWHYFPTLTIPDGATRVDAAIPARTLLIENLKPVYIEGYTVQFSVTPTTLGMDPFSVQAAAYRMGAEHLGFYLDDILSHVREGRHRLTESTPLSHWAGFYVETGGVVGRSRKDNRDMVGTRELAVA